MSWLRKPKELDFSETDVSHLSSNAPDFSVMPSNDIVTTIPFELAQEPAGMSRDEIWERLGEHAWNVLARRRMAELWPGAEPTEFMRYLQLLERTRATHPQYADEIFVGLAPPRATRDGHPVAGFSPFFVPRFVFQRHAYILGGTGFGKTSSALATLLLQLATPYGWINPERPDKAPLLIIQLKQDGDRFLRTLAEDIAKAHGRRFRFFSTDPEYESDIFDPLHSLRTIQYPLKLLETLLKAFSLIYPEGYGSDFFTNEQRVQLMKILYEENPQTMDELIRFVGSATSGASGNKDARGLYSALAALQYAENLHTDGSPVDPDRLIDFDRFFEDGEVLYVHLDARGNYLLARDIGKLMLFSLLETASQREKRGALKQAFVCIDEFHRLAARNIVEMLEDARSAGIGFVLAHQSSSSLQTREMDLYGTLFENCSSKQCLTLEDPRVCDLFTLISGRVTERRAGHSEGTNESQSKGTGTSDARSHVKTYGQIFGVPSHSSESESFGRTHANQTTFSDTTGRERSDSWQEEKVPGLTPEMIQEVNDVGLLSLVHVKGVGNAGLTPTGGKPTPIQGLFPFSKSQYQKMSSREWPRKPHIDPEQYYRKVPPRIPAAAVQALAARDSSKHDRRRKYEQPRNEGEQRGLHERIVTLAEKLTSQMIAEPFSVEAFARRHRLRIEVVLAEGKAMGLDLTAKESLIKARDAEKLRQRIAASTPRDQPKDNGSQGDPLSA